MKEYVDLLVAVAVPNCLTLYPWYNIYPKYSDT